MNRTYTIPSRFDPSYSLLGRWLRIRVDDRRRAESLFVVVSGIIALVLVLSQYIGWAIVQPQDPFPVFTLFQVLLAGLYALVCLVGRQPQIRVRLKDDGIEIGRREASGLAPWRLEREETVESISYRQIRRISTVDAEAYYQHYARYAGTRAFVNRIHPKLLMLKVRGGVVILGLEPSDLADFLKAGAERTAERVG